MHCHRALLIERTESQRKQILHWKSGPIFSDAMCSGPALVANAVLSNFDVQILERSPSGPGCSKLTTSLVNVSLKFQMLISEIRHYFLLKKCKKLLHCKSFSHFSKKNISVLGYKVVKHLTS